MYSQYDKFKWDFALLTTIPVKFLLGIIENILYYVSLSDIMWKFEVAQNFTNHFL